MMIKKINTSLNNEAKMIYLKYAGSKYEMERSGVLANYMNYKIPPEIESEWLKNEIESKLNGIPCNVFNSDVNDLLRLIHSLKEERAFMLLVNKLTMNLQLLDDFSKILLSEEILDSLSVKDFLSSKNKKKSLEKLKYLVSVLDKNHFEIDKSFFEKKHLKDVITDEALYKRVQNLNTILKSYL